MKKRLLTPEEIDKALRLMDKEEEWSRHQTVINELGKKKSRLSKVSQTFDKVALLLEKFDYDYILENVPVIRKLDQFFFPETWKDVEVEILPAEEEIPVSQPKYTTEGNVVHVNFNWRQD